MWPNELLHGYQHMSVCGVKNHNQGQCFGLHAHKHTHIHTTAATSGTRSNGFSLCWI